MNPDKEVMQRIQRADSPVAFFGDRIWFSEPLAIGSSTSYFGGELGVSVEPLTSAQHLRRTLTLDLHHFDVGDPTLNMLPLIFPQTLSGGKMEYDASSGSGIRITALRGKPSDQWPYANYPSEFPLVPLAFSKPERCTYEQFIDGLPQAPHDARDKMVVALPPTEESGKFGVGVWFPLGEDPLAYVW